jgi:hypothetical protein
MSDTVDLRRYLKNWPYDADNDARIVRGEDGREILQVRTPLGIEQLELDGRPDGEHPQGMESVLEVQLQRLEQARAAGRETGFELGPRECGDLFNEGTLYYFRYVRLFQLKDWARTVRDTARNLRAFDLVHQYGQREEDREFLERWRPYVIRVNTSAAVMIELDKRGYDTASKLTNQAISAIEGLEELDDETFKFERERSLAALRELTTQIQQNRPLSEVEKLEHQLRRAIERQDFERAARLRDRIRALKNQQVC